MNNHNILKSSELPQVKITGGYWSHRCETNEKVTLKTEYEQLKDTGRLDAFKLQWKEGMPNKPHFFWDSDIAKWIEACAYSLVNNKNDDIEKACDLAIDDIEKAQWEDGYINIYYSVTDKTQRWTNLLFMHELYCAGHLMEAAVEYYKATGKDRFLKIMCRYADHIDSVFGKEEGKLKGYPGHEEIELALVKLYEVTGNIKYLNLARYFIDERGNQPHYYDIEEKVNNITRKYNYDRPMTKKYAYVQAHVPVREQDKVEGHSVRAMYLLSGMADIARITHDDELKKACERLYHNTVNQRMYITGGIGSASDVERFTFDYDLPNETAYAETCAAIGLVFFTHRMFHLDADGKYIDTLERALYNGVMSGISLDGTSFFYSNPLSVKAEAVERETLGFSGHMGYKRRKWFGCACCPPNIARLLSSLGKYFYSVRDNDIFVNLYGTSEIKHNNIKLTQKTNYPWDGNVNISIETDKAAEFTLALRIPGWCSKYDIVVNGTVPEYVVEKGYLFIKISGNDEIVLNLSMPVIKIISHPSSRHNTGKIALMRGPLVYCAEHADNEHDVFTYAVSPGDEFLPVYDENFLGGCTYLTGDAYILSDKGFEDSLYIPYRENYEKTKIKLIPYSLWTNREPGDMTVWFNKK